MIQETNSHSTSQSSSSKTTPALTLKGLSRLVKTNYNNMSDLKILANYSEIHKEHIVLAVEDTRGERIKWKFPNGYGASVVATSSTQWRPNLMVLCYSGELDIIGSIERDNSITGTACGSIDQISVSELIIVLAKIQGLKDYVPK